MNVIELPHAWSAMNSPIEVDVGSHRGTFLVAMAQLYPDRRFLGIERQAGRVERCLKKIERLALANAFAVQSEGLAVFRELESKAAVIHVSFPDPWPKRRHQSKRLVNDRFLRDAWNCLEPQGMLRLMTDDAVYFRAMETVVEACDGFAPTEWDDGREYPPTEFQMKFTSRPVHRLALLRCASMSSE
ncbi:MAG: tRNA (guanine(46)-N(7))-methyltransferase TrmB [Chthoniobacterales bacterium]